MGEPSGPSERRAFLSRLLVLAAASASQPALALPGDAVGVLFPDIGKPLRKVFTDIIAGIEEQARERVRGYPIGPQQDLPELAQALKRNGTRVVVALGRQGLRAAAGVEAPLGLVVSGVSSLPDAERQVGICLTPDPALLFAQLRNVLPGVRRVLVIVNALHNDWLLKLAREAARAQGLDLQAHDARDLAGAVRLYETVMASADARRDALWLPTDATTVEEATILPMVLREAWNRNLALFSSTLLHVKKGALFALYPDNHALGRSLGMLARALLAGEGVARGATPLRGVHAALNVRTAGHLGLAVGERMQRSFHALYPEP